MASVTICDEHSVDALKARLIHIYKVIETYRWIIEAYVSDFYVKDHWSGLPVSWQEFLGQLDFSYLRSLLTGQPWCQPTTHSSVSPLSLLALKACCEHLSLNRHCVDLDSPSVKDSVKYTFQNASSNRDENLKNEPEAEQHKEPESKTLGFKNGQLMDMQHIFRKHVKPKKQHEIRQLGKVISLVSRQAGTEHVVDVGAGLGHLSRLLTFAHGLKVTTVEATGGHAPKASEFDRELKKDIQKKLKKGDLSSQEETTPFVTPTDLPSHVICTVQPDITTQDFLNLVLRRDSAVEGSKEEHTSSTSTLTKGCSVNQNDVISATEDEALEVSQKGSAREINSSMDFTAFVSHIGEKSTGLHLNVRESCKVLQKEYRGDITAGLYSGESAAKVSRYDHENQSLVTNHRNQNNTVCSDLLLSASSSKSQVLSESQSMPQTRREKNSQTNQTLSSCDEGDTQNTEQSQQNQEICDGANNEMKSVGPRADIGPESSTTVKEGAEEDDKTQRLVLAGLHACGDLTATLLRVFVNCSAVSALVSVACCYMKLSAYSRDDDDDMTCERGYPMSQFVRNLPAHPLTYEAREMACHFADAYAQRLIDNPPHLKIHSYRAAVQYIITQTREDFPHGATRLVVKKGAEMPFPEYAKVCLQRLGIDPSEVSDGVMTTADSLTADWQHVVAFYTLRLSLAPLVETAVLLDRMLFLYEHGVQSVLLPVFDSALSPRNFALLACRPSSS